MPWKLHCALQSFRAGCKPHWPPNHFTKLYSAPCFTKSAQPEKPKSVVVNRGVRSAQLSTFFEEIGCALSRLNDMAHSTLLGCSHDEPAETIPQTSVRCREYAPRGKRPCHLEAGWWLVSQTGGSITHTEIGLVLESVPQTP